MLTPWKKSYDELSMLKSRDITLLTKVRIVKALVFPVAMYRCESSTIKKAEHWRTDAFELWWWRRTLESRLDSKEIKPVNPKGNQPWIFTGRTNVEAEAPIPWSLDAISHWKRPWCWERSKAGAEGGNRGWDCWMASSTQWTRVWANSGRWWRTRKPGMLKSMGSQRTGCD